MSNGMEHLHYLRSFTCLMLLSGLPCITFANSELEIGGRILFDVRNHIHSDQNSSSRIHTIDDIDLRTVRFQVDAGNPGSTKTKFSVEYSSGEPNVKDGYLERDLTSQIEFRIGQFHVPFGNESLGSSRFALFQEDSAISDALSASRDIGIMLHGPFFSKHTYFQFAYMNGSGSNVSDNNDTKDFATRCVFRPFFVENENVNLWLGFSYTTGKELSAEDDIKIETESNSGYRYFKAVIPEGVSYDRNRYDLEYTLLLGAFMIKGELIRTTYFSPGTYVEGGYVATSYILSGEKHKIKNGLLYRQISKELTGEKSDNTSAIGFAFRYSWFRVSDDFFKDDTLYDGWQGISLEDYSRSGEAFTFGLNWYINRETRFIGNWIFSFADVDDPQQPGSTITKQVETSITTRLQVDF